MTSEAADTILTRLKKRPIKNLSITGFMQNNPVSKVETLGDSVVICGHSDRDWYYWHSNIEDEFRALLDKVKDEAVFYGGLEDWMVPIVAELGRVEWTLPMLSYYLTPDIYILDNAAEIRELSVEDIDFILRNAQYKQFLSKEYLTQRICNSCSAGIYVDGILTAWGMTHDDGSIGVVHVINNFRRKGYGKEIVISLAHQIRAKNQIPFAQIEMNNIASLWLFEKLGFQMDRQLTWLKLMR